MPFDARIDAYIAARAEFARPILEYIRAQVHAACPEVVETIKWSLPHFDYRGRPLAGMAAFKAHASFGFWERAALATGKEGMAMGQFGRIGSIADLPEPAAFQAKVREAMALIEAGVRAARAGRSARPEVAAPAELVGALAGDAAAAAMFEAFPPSARREYCEWIAGAKRPETRAARLSQTMEWLREGKRRNWKYEKC